MSNNFALSPIEAAYIATNVYFTLEGWEATYKFKSVHGDGAKGAPSPKPGMATANVITRNVVGSGPTSVSKLGVNAVAPKAFQASTGSNLVGRTRSGFGYFLEFQRAGKKHLVIATRGTRPEMGYPDLLTDLNVSLNRAMPGIGPVHGGFYDVFNSIKDKLSVMRNAIEAADIVHCVGHSLGGAVANLVAIHCAQSGANVCLYTFGAPRVGLRTAMYDQVLKNVIGEKNIFRVSHSFDPIPMIPVAPYIHVLPSVRDRNNFFIGSTVNSISMANHDTGNYIKSVGSKDWDELRSDKLKNGYLDKQYFQNWRSSDSWLKRHLGESLNAQMTALQRILQGLIDTIGVGLTEVATIIDLFVIAVRQGIEIYQVAKNYIVKFINDCAKLLGLGVDISKEILSKILRKLMTELAIAAKMSIAMAAKLAKSKEFHIFLAAASAGSIGLMLM